MLKLKALKFKNIGRFVERQFIDFDQLGNLVQVDAQNNNTGGSSGSGKSTVFNALDWLLGLSDLSTNVLQSRLTKETISVEGIFDWDGKETVISRSKKLSITVDGIETTGSSKITEELLDTIIGMPRNLFRPLLHKKQGETGFFLQMTPAQMNSFLTDCLGLSAIRSKIDVVEQKSKTLTSDKIEAQISLQANQAALEATKSAIATLGVEPFTNITEEQVNLVKNELSLSKSALEITDAQHKSEKEVLEKKKPKLRAEPFNRTILEALDVQVLSLKSKILKIQETEKERQATVIKEISDLKLSANTKTSALKLENTTKSSEIKAELVRLKGLMDVGKISKEEAIKIAGQIKTLRSGICDKCKQSWVTEQAKLEDERLLKELGKHKTNIEAASRAKDEIGTLEGTFSTLNEHYNARIAELTDQTTQRLNELNEQTKYKEPEAEIEPIKKSIEQLTSLLLEERKKEETHNLEQNALNNKVMEDFFSEQKLLSAKHQKELALATKEAEEKRSLYENADSTFRAHQEALKRYKTNLDILKNKLSEMTLKIVHMDQKLGQLSQNTNIAEEVKRCLKSYLSCSFDDSLDYISDTATRILRSVPTMANATIRLEGIRETAAGAIKEQVTAVLDNDGEIDIPIKSLSGGERSAVDLAVDLAVCVLIQDKANKGVDTMILDEPFNGFDSVGIEHALEMLKTFALDKRILIVEHDSVAKEFITDKITIVRTGETSCVNSS